MRARGGTLKLGGFQLFESNLLERALGLGFGVELLAQLLECGTVFVGEDWRLPSSLRGPVLSRALAVFASWLAGDMGMVL